MNLAIEIDDLTLVLGGRTILDIPYLAVEQGESVALMGPNGAGKSSLLMVMAALQEPTGGRISFFGHSREEHPRVDLQRRMAMVFQKPMLLDLSVHDNMDLGLRFRGLERKERAAKVSEWLEVMEISHLSRQRARSLSGGEAQRVAIAQALILEPEIVFLDEPFSNLDKEIRGELMGAINKLLKKNKITTVMVTHHRREAEVMTDTVYWMEDGEIVKREKASKNFGKDKYGEAVVFTN